jgi:hypothetical protein
MKPIRWTPHASAEMAKRDVDRAEAESAILQPDAVFPARPPREFRQRRYLDKTLGEEMLLRVLVEDTGSELVVVTLYKTSKFKKYEPGQSI